MQLAGICLFPQPAFTRKVLYNVNMISQLSPPLRCDLMQAADTTSRTAQSAKEQAAQGYQTGKQKGAETAEVAERKAGQAAQATKETAQQVKKITLLLQ